jgi:hypothetical protein
MLAEPDAIKKITRVDILAKHESNQHFNTLGQQLPSHQNSSGLLKSQHAKSTVNFFIIWDHFFFYAAKLNCASHCQNKPTETVVASPMISHGQTRYAC